ncbi:VOC family protein [uncultured Williamsia sp.]|uniref:VOC family protein n=1 Tax=uncultured Williamsia sp. TaxID=259311 RepID=UPI00261BF1B9|nr:VOC family protein [uncultured Williamsia sp.]
MRGAETDDGSLVEWQAVPGAWIQVYADADRAGRTQLNLAVDDLDAEIAAVTARGVEVGDVVEANKGVRLAPITDPDGNVVTLIGGFRVDY